VPLSPSSIIWYQWAVMLGGWGGNRGPSLGKLKPKYNRQLLTTSILFVLNSFIKKTCRKRKEKENVFCALFFVSS